MTTLVGCGSRFYGIELNNVGKQKIIIQRLQWDIQEIAGDSSVGIQLSAIPAGGITTGQQSMHVSYRIPESVFVTWTPEGAAAVSAEFELRKHVDNAETYRDLFVFEFDGAVLRVFSATGSAHTQTDKKLIAEVR